MNLNSQSASTFQLPSGPSSPTLGFGEDLNRFPSESLHSFSFKSQGEHSAHSRHAILRRSVDFLRDRQGHGGSGLGLATAQAKISGDLELQGMVDLLSRAQVLGNKSGAEDGLSFPLGPLTGPADPSGNVFEKTFMRTESPTNLNGGQLNHSADGSPIQLKSPKITFATPDDSDPHSTKSGGSGVSNRRLSLKRTYTDVSALSLQNQLSDVLSQPYLEKNNQILSPIEPGLSHSFLNGPAHHAHDRAGPTSQAIFTTQNQAPWTITAANDLACLIFGVTKAELRKIGILDVVREDKRKWLEQRLRGPVPKPVVSSSSTASSSPRRGPSPMSSMLANGKGLTAKLLSKPPSRETGQGQRGAAARRAKALETDGSTLR